MHISVRHFLLAIILGTSLVVPRSEASTAGKCGALLATAAITTAIVMTAGLFTFRAGEHFGYQKALADIAKIYEQERNERALEIPDPDNSLKNDRFLLIDSLSKSPLFKNQLASLSPKDQAAVRALIVLKKINLLTELLPDAPANSVDELLKSMHLPHNVAEEIKTKGIFDGMEYWPLQTEEISPGRFRLNVLPPESLAEHLKDFKPEQNPKQPEFARPPSLDREV